MSKRFTDTEIWDQDWFIELPAEYKLFWGFIKDRCSHAGIWKPNKAKFERLTNSKVELPKAFELFNKDKERLVKLNSGHWLLTQFIHFQYGSILNTNSLPHLSIIREFAKEEVNMTSLRPQVEVKQTPKDKDKDKDSCLSKGSKSSKREEIEF